MKKVGDIFKETSDRRLKEDLRSNSGLFFFNYAGVSSAALTQLRRDLKGTGARMFVTKNTFISLALKDIYKGKETSDFVKGPLALIFVKDDPVAPSKVLTDFIKKHEAVNLRGGFINDRVVNPQEFKMIANIPPRQVLYQQIAAMFNSPATKLAVSLKQVVAKLAYALDAVSNKKK